MDPIFDKFIKLLEQENKEESLNFIMEKLASGEVDIVTLYTDILAPSLNKMKCEGPEEYCIWKEHVRSSIKRTIIENCYPYVIKERDEKYGGTRAGEKVMVICPPEELHEIGPRMVADFFTLLGFDVTFVGANTPKLSFLSAIEDLKPKYVAVSVSNYYNLIAAEKTISAIREGTHGRVKIIAGGCAFDNNPEAYKKIGADFLMHTFKDLKKLRGGD